MRRFLIILVVVAALGCATAQGDAPKNSLTCQGSYPAYFSCYYERVGWGILGLQGSAAASATYDPRSGFTLAPYTVLSYYGERLDWWVEVRVPEGIVPLIGDGTTMLTVGFTRYW